MDRMNSFGMGGHGHHGYGGMPSLTSFGLDPSKYYTLSPTRAGLHQHLPYHTYHYHHRQLSLLILCVAMYGCGAWLTGALITLVFWRMRVPMRQLQ
jgi:hypothetical protein